MAAGSLFGNVGRQIGGTVGTVGRAVQAPLLPTLINQYGAPQSQQPAAPDFSFLDPNSPNYNAALGMLAGVGGQGTGEAGTGGGTTAGGTFDPNTIANVQRDVALQGQYGNLLNANQLYNRQSNELSAAGLRSAERYGQEQSGLQRGQITEQGQEAQFQAGQQARAQQSSAAASGSTVSQGNRSALGDIQTNLDFTMKTLFGQLMQLGNADKYRQETEYQQLQGIQNLSTNQQANYQYQQAANQTAIQDALQPYKGML